MFAGSLWAPSPKCMTLFTFKLQEWTGLLLPNHLHAHPLARVLTEHCRAGCLSTRAEQHRAVACDAPCNGNSCSQLPAHPSLTPQIAVEAVAQAQHRKMNLAQLPDEYPSLTRERRERVSCGIQGTAARSLANLPAHPSQRWVLREQVLHAAAGARQRRSLLALAAHTFLERKRSMKTRMLR